MIDMDVIHIFALKDNRIFTLNRKVEEMQKTLEWYAEMKFSCESMNCDGGERARTCLKGVNP